MDTERYLKLATLAAILIIGLVYPVVAALALTAVAAWHLENFRISDMALLQKIVRLTPPGIKAMIVSPVNRAAQAPLKAIAAPDPLRDRALAERTKTPEPIIERR